MKKPEELVELLTVLARENTRSSVVTTPTSHAIVYIGKNELHLSTSECILLLHDADSVSRFAETISSSENANLELRDLVLSEEAQSALEMHFSTVDDI